MKPQTLAATSLAVTATAVAGGLASDPDNDWYRQLRKPPFQPPPVTFPVVWTALYAAIAAASAETIDAAKGDQRTRFEVALATNLTLNAAWTWLFFRARKPALATAGAAVLAGSTADLARRANKVSRRAHALLAPYLGWTSFATVLAGSIAWLNRDRAS